MVATVLVVPSKIKTREGATSSSDKVTIGGVFLLGGGKRGGDTSSRPKEDWPPTTMSNPLLTCNKRSGAGPAAAVNGGSRGQRRRIFDCNGGQRSTVAVAVKGAVVVKGGQWRRISGYGGGQRRQSTTVNGNGGSQRRSTAAVNGSGGCQWRLAAAVGL
ncbi:hypothetical protein Q3G72_001709 [Acer saccharum]|nr:hypothetical protein Q3G72_001709 [Acer saccharum]